MVGPKLVHEIHHGRMVRAHAVRPANISLMFSETVARAPRRDAVIDGALRLDYVTLDRHVATVAAALTTRGVGSGDRVALLLGNRADFLVAVLATARLGAIIVPMNIRQKAPETAYVLTLTGAAVLLYEAALADDLPGQFECPSLRHRIPVDDDMRLWTLSSQEPAPDIFVEEDAPFAILCTSGTTGRPKGAVLTHFGAITSVLGARDALGLRDGEVTVLAVPASHVTGLVLELLEMIAVAGTSVMMRAFKARAFLELASRERLTYTCMVPAMYNLCLLEPDYASFDLSSWRSGTFGGAAMPDATISALTAWNPALKLTNIYGSTETTSPAVMMPSELISAHSHQVGRALPYVDLMIMDENGREVPRGEQGEIWLGGPMTVPFYWNDPDATAKGFADGFWKSGDIGILDADGFLTLCDRKKDMINRGGFKIYSVEVENVLMAHPGVIEAGVVGRPCAVLGERTHAFVQANQEISEAELRAWCAERLSDYKVPDGITLCPEPLPRNANGKLLKTDLRQLITDAGDKSQASPRNTDDRTLA